jgi:hypothetical protein
MFSRTREINTSRIGKENHQCTLLTLDCKKDAKLISYLTGIAVAQKANFISVFPWETKCEQGDILYVAIDHDEKIPVMESLKSLSGTSAPLICGWARVLFSQTPRDKGGQRYAFISEISTSTNRTKFKGIGTDIINTIANEKIKNKKIDFIKLTALPDAVSFYKKIGFYSDDRTREMYKIIESEPSEKYIESEMEYTNEIIEDIKKNLKLKSNGHDLIKRFMNYTKKNKDNIDIVIDVYENGTIEDVIDLISA